MVAVWGTVWPARSPNGGRPGEVWEKGKVQGLIPGESRVVLNPPGRECRSQQPLIRVI